MSHPLFLVIASAEIICWSKFCIHRRTMWWHVKFQALWILLSFIHNNDWILCTVLQVLECEGTDVIYIVSIEIWSLTQTFKDFLYVWEVQQWCNLSLVSSRFLSIVFIICMEHTIFCTYVNLHYRYFNCMYILVVISCYCITCRLGILCSCTYCGGMLAGCIKCFCYKSLLEPLIEIHELGMQLKYNSF